MIKFIIIFGLFFLFIVTTTIIITYNALIDNLNDKSKILGIKILNIPFLIGSFIGFVLFFTLIYYYLLFFIPSNWGYINSEGDWTPYRIYIPTFLSIITSFMLFINSKKVIIYIRKFFVPREIKIIIKTLNEIEKTIHNDSFFIVKEIIDNILVFDTRNVLKSLTDMNKKEAWIYSLISNITGDLIESGEYHIFRGILDPLREGKKILKLYDYSIGKLEEIGEFEKEFSSKQKDIIRKNLRYIG